MSAVAARRVFRPVALTAADQVGLLPADISGFSDHPLLTSGTTRFRVLAKPFRPDDLLRALREQLDGT